MTTLSAGLDAALAADVVTIFFAIEIALPGGTIRLLDGAGVVEIDGELFTGEDATFGIWGGIESLGDGVDTQSPRISVSLKPPSTAAAATLANPAAQGSAFYLRFGALDPASGLIVDDCDLCFVGELDVPILNVSEGDRTLVFEVASVWERFFRNDEGARLTDAFHQSIWPGERGFEYVTGVLRQLPWGTDLPRPSSITSGSTPGGVGGGSFDIGQIF